MTIKTIACPKCGDPMSWSCDKDGNYTCSHLISTTMRNESVYYGRCGHTWQGESVKRD